MDYDRMIREYEDSLDSVNKAIQKYERKIRHSSNKEELNAKIFNLELTQSDLIYTINQLKFYRRKEKNGKRER